jgi:hypothetical protein
MEPIVFNTIFVDLYCKTIRIHNFRKMDRFCSKLVYFQLSVIFTGLDKDTASQNTLAYYRIRTL